MMGAQSAAKLRTFGVGNLEETHMRAAIVTLAALSLLAACQRQAGEQRTDGQKNEPVNIAQDAAGAATGAAGGGSEPDVTEPDGAAGSGSGRVSTEDMRELWHPLSASAAKAAKITPVLDKAIPDLLRSCPHNPTTPAFIAEAIIGQNFNHSPLTYGF